MITVKLLYEKGKKILDNKYAASCPSQPSLLIRTEKVTKQKR